MKPEWLAEIDWIIVGGESGSRARPMHPDWVRAIRDACAAANVPFHFKQWGEWKPGSDFAADAKIILTDGRLLDGTRHIMEAADRDAAVMPCHPTYIRKVGAKRSGRDLDGIIHEGFPGRAA